MDDKHRVVFSHPVVDQLLSVSAGKYSGSRQAITYSGSLEILTGLNQITWGYGLNSITYPTYGGEVVQNLSAYIDDLSVEGEVFNVPTMEEIYVWFLTYMTIATQGFRLGGEQYYNEDDVSMHIPFREWNFKIRPKELPGLRYATEQVAPTWSLTAAIVESDDEIREATLQGAVEGLERITAGVGYEQFDPFSAPTRSKTFVSVSDGLHQLGTEYQKLVEQFAQHQVDGVLAVSPSGPTPAKKTKVQTKPGN